MTKDQEKRYKESTSFNKSVSDSSENNSALINNELAKEDINYFSLSLDKDDSKEQENIIDEKYKLKRETIRKEYSEFFEHLNDPEIQNSETKSKDHKCFQPDSISSHNLNYAMSSFKNQKIEHLSKYSSEI